MDSEEDILTPWFLEGSHSLDPTYHERSTATQCVGPTYTQPDKHASRVDPKIPTNPPTYAGNTQNRFHFPSPSNEQFVYPRDLTYPEHLMYPEHLPYPEDLIYPEDLTYPQDIMHPEDLSYGGQIRRGLPEWHNGVYITNPYPNDSDFLTPRCFLQDNNQQNMYAADGYQRGGMPGGEFKIKGRTNEAARSDPDRTIRQTNHNRPIRQTQVTETSHKSVREPTIGSMLKLNGKLYEVVGTIDLQSIGGSHMNEGIHILLNPKGILVVQKKLTMATKEKRDRASAEKKALKQIASAGGQSNINKIYESVWENGSVTSLILEYCNRGTLAEFIEWHKVRNIMIGEEFCWKTLYHLSCALAMCHSGIRDITRRKLKPQDWNTICHLDIKPANIFLDYQDEPEDEHATWPRIVLGDFGCAVTRNDIMSGKIDHKVQPWGTPFWFPPENESTDNTGMNTIGAYGKHTDIWQMGGVIQVMCALTDCPEMDYIDKIPGRCPAGPDYSAELNKVLMACMARNAAHRPKALNVALYIHSLKESRMYYF